MSKRLQVVMDEAEFEEIRAVAERHRMTVSEWVRHSLREARRAEPVRPADEKLRAVRQATRHAYPTGDIDQMLDEISRGYQDDSTT